MSLNFSYHGKEDTKQWSKDDWSFYNALVWGTLATDIGYLCEESADEFVRRANVTNIFTQTIKKEELVKFYGLSTNVETLSAQAWAIKHFANKNHEGKQYNSAWVKKVNSASNKHYYEGGNHG